MPKAVRTVTAPNLIAIAHLMRELQRGALSMPELAEITGLNLCTVQRYCAALYKAKASFITDWRRDSRGYPTIRIYQLGEGIDALAPVVDRKEKARRQRVTRAALRQEFERTGSVDTALLAKARGHTLQRVGASFGESRPDPTAEHITSRNHLRQ